jgi:hypothetical protein
MAGPERLGRVLSETGRGISFTCSDCGHAGRMARAEALKTFGDGATPNRIRERLRCSRCGSRRCEVRV